MSREKKFARILAIADMLSKHTYEKGRQTVEHRYRTLYSRKPAKFLKVIHEELMEYSKQWSDKDWLLYEVLADEIANLNTEDITNEELDYLFHLYLSKAKVEMWNIVGVDQAAEILGLSPGTVKNKCAKGDIPAKKVGKTWVIDKRVLK
ncbi:helix-turn-helix domain-containing protein [Halalkalibacterium halodurans]|uniref:helix-turn-helix domain-containing protein n=1 Tax=Halalkalibacterium halodurans TaxID=86665 RepID=UPI002E1F7B7B|nr:helix-turn-helix domain-containing protein [Halalkalibacterium halodurans]MED4105494.1 helix-turn-helix domain-containing protein [Halalkalibacterium halodurans]MED4109300.1 helix-turn-helix domain-containing protein [Halalkalibacterium halodurans]MED4149686.1 helix-turn-helix domain-containing protein [Halalkalibacterium halodurans]